MAEIIRGTNIADPIVPYTTADNIPTHYAKYGKGGFRTVNTFSELGQIPEMRLEPGMAVFVIDEQKTYQYLRISKPDEEPAVYDWKKGKLGGGGVEVVENWAELDESEKLDLEEDGTIIYVVSGEEQDPTGKRNIYPDQFFYFANGSWVEYGQIYVGPIEPKNKNSIWIDDTDHHYDENNNLLYSIQKAVSRLQEQVSTLMTLRTNGVISGSVENSERMNLVNSADPEKPIAKIETEAAEFEDKYIITDEEGQLGLNEDFLASYSLIYNSVDLVNEIVLAQSYIDLNPEWGSVIIYSLKELFDNNPSLELQYNEFAPNFLEYLERSTNNLQDIVDYLEELAESSTSVRNFEINFIIDGETESDKILNVEVFTAALERINSLSTAEALFSGFQAYIVFHPERSENFVQILKEIILSEENADILQSLENLIPGFETILSRCTNNIETIISRIKLLDSPGFDSDTNEEEPDKTIEPTVRHISIKMGTYEQLYANKKNFIPGELMWGTDKKKLYIYISGELIAISGSGGDPDPEPGNDDFVMDEEIKQQIRQLIHDELLDPGVEAINFIPIGSDQATYTAKVDEEGRFIVYQNKLDKFPGEPPTAYYFDPTAKAVSDLNPPVKSVSKNGSGIVVNSFYLGGLDNDEHSYQSCSHNFVELSNVYVDKNGNQQDISLNGFYLFYKHTGRDRWAKLKLWGNIPAGSTFLIRGAQCSVMDVNTTKIKVKNYDMEWYETYTVTEEGKEKTYTEPVKFSQDNATFYLCWGNEEEKVYDLDGELNKEPTDSKMIDLNNAPYVPIGYVDLVGFKGTSSPIACEKNPYEFKQGSIKVNDVIFKRWYQLDPVTQSNPKDGITTHNNVKYFTASYITSEGNIDKDTLKDLVPKASWEGKSIATGRTLFAEDHPSTLTCTFGCQATDNSEVRNWQEIEPLTEEEQEDIEFIEIDSTILPTNLGNYDLGVIIKLSNDKYYTLVAGKGATRCLCWNSVGYYDEYVRYREVGTDEWIEIDSISENTIIDPNDPLYSDFNQVVYGVKIQNYYNRVRWESAYGQAITTHKVIIRGLKDNNTPSDNDGADYQGTKYEYEIKRRGEGNENYCSDLRTFTVKKDSAVTKFNFVQTTDQQGANWEEYEVWNLSARIIGADKWRMSANQSLQDAPAAPNFDFTINTGDICYNGSRSNEWIDYYEGYKPLKNKEEMLTIGNNDLAPISMRDIGNGGESPWKINVNVIDYFYCVEIDPLNPQIFSGNKYSNGAKENDKPVYPNWNIGQTFKIPSLYSFNYGKLHFISLLSEMRTLSGSEDLIGNGSSTSASSKAMAVTTVNGIFGVEDTVRGFIPNTEILDRIYDEVPSSSQVDYKSGLVAKIVNPGTFTYYSLVGIWRETDQPLDKNGNVIGVDIVEELPEISNEDYPGRYVRIADSPGSEDTTYTYYNIEGEWRKKEDLSPEDIAELGEIPEFSEFPEKIDSYSIGTIIAIVGVTYKRLYNNNGIWEWRDVADPTNVSTASKIFDREEEWIIRDLIKWKNGGTLPRISGNANYWTEPTVSSETAADGVELYDPSWKHREIERNNSLIKNNCHGCVVFTHEMPFNIISSSSYRRYDIGASVPRETAKAYLNRYHNFEYQRLFKLWGIPLVMGGHKHTAAITYPVYDAPDNFNPTSSNNNIMKNTGPNGTFSKKTTFNPFIQVRKSDVVGWWEGLDTKIKNFCGEIYNNTNQSIDLGGGDAIAAKDSRLRTIPNKSRFRLEIVDSISAPSYVMCQATGFKNKSNSDLAAGENEIPWERFYVAGDTDGHVVGQCYPFFTLYEVTDNNISVKMYKIDNMYGGTKDLPQDQLIKGKNKAGYWDLTRRYLPGKSLEANRSMIVSECYLDLFNIGGTNIAIN